MAIIVGAGTSITGFTGVVSANWGLEPNVQRLWEIGSFTPYDILTDIKQTASITCYGGGGPIISPTPSTSCVDSDSSVTLSISPGVCLAPVDGVSGLFYIDSYSYSKGDVKAYGQETYSMSSYVDSVDNPAPDFILLGVPTGQKAGDVSNFGVVIDPVDATGQTGSVSAGSPGLGEGSTTSYGVVSSFGGGTGKENGKKGSSSATMPHTPVYTGV